MTPALATPISTTIVSAAESAPGRRRSEWPVTIATDVAYPRAVTGNPGAGRDRQRGRDTGHDLEGNARGLERQRLLGAAAEEQRVAALESHDAMAGSGRRHQLIADHMLARSAGRGRFCRRR